MAIRKARTGKKNQDKNQKITYYLISKNVKFARCEKAVIKKEQKVKHTRITIKSTEHEEQAAFQETEEFKELAKKRYKIEAKNSELKIRHGYKTAKSAGLFGMEIQGATTIFAVNLKRILKLLNEKE